MAGWLGARVTGECGFAPLVDGTGDTLREVTCPVEISDLCRNECGFLHDFYTHVHQGFTLVGCDRKETIHTLLDSILDCISHRRKNTGFDPWIHDEDRLFYSTLRLSGEDTIRRYARMYRKYSGRPFDKTLLDTGGSYIW